jgi:hypothetical protein
MQATEELFRTLFTVWPTVNSDWLYGNCAAIASCSCIGHDYARSFHYHRCHTHLAGKLEHVGCLQWQALNWEVSCRARWELERFWAKPGGLATTEEKVDWDNPVPQPLHDAWLQWRTTDQQNICCYSLNTAHIASIQIYGFCDAIWSCACRGGALMHNRYWH